MSPPDSQSSSILGFFTPTIDLTPQNQHPPPKSVHQTGSGWTAPFRDGLPTPPGDMTGVTYNAMPAMNYGGKAHSMAPHIYPHSRSHYDSVPSMMPVPLQDNLAPVKDVCAAEPAQKKTGRTAGGPQLHVPSSINNSKGSLAEFAAQMTCLFWFEKTSKLQAIEDRLHPVPSLVAEAIPSLGFQKWVTSILSTTQVSSNVILLALLYIYRLKKFNSGVKGKKGSEFRLMTVALMLGNKFLDDNTYTNKTWAEVSGIAVQEIHIMEVEFLSNIRYDLFASEAEWTRWHTELGLFGEFFNQASMFPVETDGPILRVSPPRLPVQSPTSTLPSPPSDALRPHSQPWYIPGPGLPYPVASPVGQVASGGRRKRSRDEDDELQPMKRAALGSNLSTPVPMAVPTNMHAMPTLPPVLTPTSAPVAQGPTSGNVSGLPPPNPPSASNPMPQSVPTTVMSQLPVPALMPPVYNRAPNWSQHMPSAAVPPLAPGMYHAPSLSDLARQHQSPFGVSSATVSPAVSAYSVHTPQTHLSPSFFLANRNSPYRPVRSVHTLLIPPPSASLQEQRDIPFNHMHYQPLSKGNVDRKTGLLPYIQPDAWNQGTFQPYYPPSQSFSG